ARQRRLGELRLWLSDAEHKRQLAAARAENDRAIATAVRQEEAANTALETAARSLQRQLVVELEQAKAALEDLPVSPLMPAALDGLQSLYSDATSGPRLGDVIQPEPGYEKALAAVLGPLADALVALDAKAAIEAAGSSSGQTTVLYPSAAADAAAASLVHHVRLEAGYEAIARAILGGVVVGRDVTLDGVYHVPGMIRAGADGRAAVAERRAHLRARIAEFEPVAETLDD